MVKYILEKLLEIQKQEKKNILEKIFLLYNSGYKQIALSKKIHISESQISKILHNKKWIV